MLPDPSLPDGSVGRNSNGNFVLTRIEAEIRAPSLDKPLRVTFTDAEAEYSQPGWGVESLIAEADVKNARRKPPEKSNRAKAGPSVATPGERPTVRWCSCATS